MTNPFKHHTRRRLTAQERAQIFAEATKQCAKCTRTLGPSDKWDADHIIPLELGGTNDLTNFQCLCEWCHVDKTAEDHAKAGHSRRTYTRHTVPGEYRRHPSWGRR